MKNTSNRIVRTAIAALMLSAVSGTARSEHIYELPSGAVIMIPSFGDEESEEAAARGLADRRQAMIEDCERNNGTECEREVETELRAEGLESGARLIHLRPDR